MPWCCYLAYYKANQRTSNVADWLIPYLAKYTDYRFKLCSKLREILSEKSRREIDSIHRQIPSLRHIARVRGQLNCGYFLIQFFYTKISHFLHQNFGIFYTKILAFLHHKLYLFTPKNLTFFYN